MEQRIQTVEGVKLMPRGKAFTHGPMSDGIEEADIGRTWSLRPEDRLSFTVLCQWNRGGRQYKNV